MDLFVSRIRMHVWAATHTLTSTLLLDVFGDPTDALGPISESGTVEFAIAQTPLPATLPLFAGGLGFVGYLTGRKKRKGGQAPATA